MLPVLPTMRFGEAGGIQSILAFQRPQRVPLGRDDPFLFRHLYGPKPTLQGLPDQVGRFLSTRILSSGLNAQRLVPLSLGGTGSSLADPGADRILFWDDSAGQVTWLTVGTGLTLSGTTLTASGGSRRLFSYTTANGNNGTSETDLFSDTVIGGTLASTGDVIEATYAGTFVSSATATRQIKVKFAGLTLLDTGTLTLSLSSAWTVYASIIRQTANDWSYMVSLATEGAALAAYTGAGAITASDLTIDQPLKITGQAAGVGAADDDILGLMGYVELKPA